MDKTIFELIEETCHEELIIWAQDCAYHVLYFYEETYPNDLRPREAIESIEKWKKNILTVGGVRKLAFRAHAAARESLNDKSMFSARSAGHAAATVHVKTHALHASNYALKIFQHNEKESNIEYLWQHERLLKIKKDQSID